MKPLVRFENQRIALPMCYCGAIPYYAVLAASEAAVIDCTTRYNKRDKDVHRMEICDTHGLLKLTVPITISPEATERPLRWRDIDVSAHGHWWTIHLTALESAYGRTPYFQFYIDRFADIYSNRYATRSIPLWQLCREMTGVICGILDVTMPDFAVSGDDTLPYSPLDTKDYRSRELPLMTPVEYYQLRADRYGFMPSLSILDLIFNMGPEAPLVLRRMIKSAKEI